MNDCIIVGGGPAGLTAALYLARFKLRCVVVDAGGGRASQIPCTRNFPGYKQGISGEHLLSNMRAQLALYDVVPAVNRIEEVVFDGAAFHARGTRATWTGRALLLATGVQDVRPILARPEDHQRALDAGALHYCPVCDGFEVSDKDVVVLGGGTHGANEALFLRSYTARVTLICPDGPHKLSESDATRLRDADIRLIDGPITPLAYEAGRLTFSSAEGEHESQAVYVAMGCKPQTRLGQSFNLALSKEGAIITDVHQRTSRPFVYAAGDVVQGLDQIAVAIGQAAIAATAIRNDLKK